MCIAYPNTSREVTQIKISSTSRDIAKKKYNSIPGNKEIVKLLNKNLKCNQLYQVNR